MAKDKIDDFLDAPISGVDSFLDAPVGQQPQGFSPVRALLTDEPTSGIAESTLRGAPAAVASMAGLLLGLPTGGLASLPAAALLGAGAEGLRQMGVQGYALARGKDVPRAREVLGSMAGEGVLQGGFQALGVGGKALAATHKGQFLSGLAKENIVAPVGRGAGRAYDWAAESLGGVGRQSIETMREMGGNVAARMGISKEGIGALGQKVRDSVAGAVKQTEDYYKSVVNQIKTPQGQPAVRLNLKDDLLGPMNEIAEDFGYAGLGGVERIADEAESAMFTRFMDVANKLESASPNQIFYFQKDINHQIRRSKGTPLALALGRVKSSVNDFIEKQSDSLPDLVSANRSYAAGKELEEDALKMVDADDLIAYVKNAYSPGKFESQKRAMIEDISTRVPEIGGLVKDIRSSLAAEQFSPPLRGLPQTGFGWGMASTGAAALAKLASPALAALPAFSPRAYYAGYRLGQGSYPGLTGAVSRTAEGAARSISTGLADNYMKNRQVP